MAFLPGERYAVLTPEPEKGHSPDHLIMHAERRKIIFKTKNLKLGKLSFVSTNFPGFTVKREEDKLLLTSLRRKREYIFESPDGGYSWRIATIRDMNFHARKVDCAYDKNGLLTGILLPNGTKYTIEYANGLPAKVSDPFGAVTTISWSSGFISGIETVLTPKHPFYPKNKARGKPFVIRSIHLQCDSVGRLVNMVNTNGERFTCEYLKNTDKKKKTSTLRGEITTPGGTVRYCQIRWNLDKSMEYDNAGRLIFKTDEDERVTKYTYDKSGFLFSVDEAGITTNYRYDDKGRPILTVFPGGAKHSFSWDPLFRMTSHKRPDGVIVKYNYAAGKVSKISTLSSDGKKSYTRTFRYDPYGKLVAVLYPDKTTARFKYNCCDLLESKDRAGAVTKFVYDSKKRKVMEETPNRLKTRFEYYDSPGLDKKISKLSKSDGTWTKFKYDEFGNLIRESHSDGSWAKYKYDPVGNRIDTTFSDGTVSHFKYDKRNRRVALTGNHRNNFKTQYSPSGALLETADYGLPATLVPRITKYLYDKHGRLVKTALPNGTSRIRYYDGLSRQLKATIEKGVITSYRYDDAGRLSATAKYTVSDVKKGKKGLFDDNIIETRAYDEFGNLKEVRRSVDVAKNNNEHKK